MSDDRKYKQRGYQSYDSEPRGRAPVDTGMPRSRVITTYKETVRCDQCGTDLSTEFDFSPVSTCSKCQAPLHTCRNCFYFDPSARFQCSQPVKERVAGKAAANECSHFTVRTISVKDIGPSSPSAPAGSDDARKALEDLFKK
jgi:hypothetical protein